MAQAVIDVPISCPEGPQHCAECAECVRQRLLQRAGIHNVVIRQTEEDASIQLDYDADLFTWSELEREIKRSGGCFSSEWGHAVLPVEGMVSPQSEHLIEAALRKMPGVLATASFAAQLVRVEFDRRRCVVPDLIRTLKAIGYRVREEAKAGRTPTDLSAEGSVEPPRRRFPSLGPFAWLAAHGELSMPLIGGLFLLAAFAAGTGSGAGWLRAPLLVASYFCCARYTGIETLHTLRHFRFDVDVLMFAAAGGAVALGRYEEGALLLMLFGVGTAGENLAMDRARRAIKALGKLAPETAIVRDADGSERRVPVAELHIGTRVVVRPYDRIPADGDVVSGASAVDQSPITGESVPVEKTIGSDLFAGTINGDGSLLMAVTRTSDECKIAKIIKLVAEAQTTRSPTQILTDRVQRWYVPGVLAATCALIFLPPTLAAGEWSVWFYRAMAFLIAASPCALAIGTPAAVLSGIARAARGGVLIKGGVHLENLGRIRAVAFDKTGTLTRGRAEVSEVFALEDHDEDELVRLAAALEMGSNHPLACAIVVEAQVRGCPPVSAEKVRQLPGLGVVGTVEGREVAVGNARMADTQPSSQLDDAIERLESGGNTAVVVSIDGAAAGVLGLADQPRQRAREVIRALRRMGVDHIVMLTGDNACVAQSVARQVGVDEHYADLLPEEKVDLLRKLEASYGRVAMVGDGVNDAPALATATVGIAMGGVGTDVALETADIALMADDLEKLPEAIGLSRFSRRIILQNLLIALGVIAVLAPVAALGGATLGFAVVCHEGSTVLVVLNALRLLRYRDDAEVSRL